MHQNPRTDDDGRALTFYSFTNSKHRDEVPVAYDGGVQQSF